METPEGMQVISIRALLVLECQPGDIPVEQEDEPKVHHSLSSTLEDWPLSLTAALFTCSSLSFGGFSQLRGCSRPAG